MAFVGSVSLATGANVLPVFTDLANNKTTTMFSHMQLVIGGTVIFDSRSSVTITGVAGTVLAIPPAARNVTLGTATALLGKVD
jgi:hypothetical protein